MWRIGSSPSNGIITKVGSLEILESEIGSDDEKVDLQGKCLMPSFIDGYGHIAMNGFMSSFADLSGCRNFDDIVDTLKRYIVKNKISSRGLVMPSKNIHMDCLKYYCGLIAMEEWSCSAN